MNRPRARRRGLAPLELVLVLPVLLFVMALMINLGTAGAWKIRTQINSRQAAWRALEHRGGANDPHPGNWPGDAEMRMTTMSPSPIPVDPYQGEEVARGPMIIDPLTGNILPVRRGYLDFRPTLRDGRAAIERPYPLLKKLPGELAFRRDHVIFDGTRFQFSSMGLGSNTSRRVLGLYPLLLELQAPEFVQDYLDAALAVYHDPNEPDLRPLTGGDPEVYSLIGQHSPNFQPNLLRGGDWRTTRIKQVRTRVPNYCESNPVTVWNEKVTPFRRAIRNLPHGMSDYYIGVYSRKISELENLDPPPLGADALIQELEAKIDQLQEFKASLPPRE